MYLLAFIPSLMASCVLRYFTDFRTNCTQNSLYAPAHPPLQRFQAAAGLTEGPLGEGNLYRWKATYLTASRSRVSAGPKFCSRSSIA